MDKQQEHLNTLKEIRSMMERSSRFLSLSGLAGIIAGIIAIAGIAAVYIFFNISVDGPEYYQYAANGTNNSVFYRFLAVDGILVLALSLISAGIITRRKARQLGHSSLDTPARRMLINLFIPLVTGGFYCFVLVYHGMIAFIAPATLIFYGLALINASKYTLNDIRYLGFIQIIIGLTASVLLQYGLLLWAFGFGILHIIYGITMYYKYEK